MGSRRTSRRAGKNSTPPTKAPVSSVISGSSIGLEPRDASTSR